MIPYYGQVAASPIMNPSVTSLPHEELPSRIYTPGMDSMQSPFFADGEEHKYVSTPDRADLSYGAYQHRVNSMGIPLSTESPKPYILPAAPQPMESKRRRTLPAVDAMANSSPIGLGIEQGAVTPQIMSPYMNIVPHTAPQPMQFCFPPAMMPMGVPGMPPSGSLQMNGSMSPLAHRGAARPLGPDVASPSLLIQQQQQIKVEQGMSPLINGFSPPIYDAHAVRRANSYSAMPPWPTPDAESFFAMPRPLPSSASVHTIASPDTVPGTPRCMPSCLNAAPLQRQYSAPQPRTIRERSERRTSTDVWPDDVEVAFWEALRLIPKLGRRKVLVHGKPCGRNELIADYIERKTNKSRSRKQVSSHIQVLKNVKRHDPEFRQLIAEPVVEEDYYTPAGGVMYAQSLTDYSNGLLGVSLTNAEASLAIPASPASEALSVPYSPALSSSLSSCVTSPMLATQSPRNSPGSTMVNAFDSLHFSASPQSMNTEFAPKHGALALSELEVPPSLLPSAFSMRLQAACSDDQHVYTLLDAAASARVLQSGAPIPVLPLGAPSLSASRFPMLAEMYAQLTCPIFHIHVPLALPRLAQKSPQYDKFNVALSLTGTQNTNLVSVLSIFSHAKCVLCMVEPLEPPRALAAFPAAQDAPQGGSESPAPAPTPGADRFSWAYQAPFASEFWSDFFQRNHPVHLYGAGGMEPKPNYSKEPSERAALSLDVAGVTFLQELVVARGATEVRAQTMQNPSEPVGHASRGAALGEILCVLAWEFACTENNGAQPGVPSISLVRRHSCGVPSAGSTTPRRHTLAAAPDTPTRKGASAQKTMLGLELEPLDAPVPSSVKTERDAAANTLVVPMQPTITHTDATPRAPMVKKEDEEGAPKVAPASARKLASAAQGNEMHQDQGSFFLDEIPLGSRASISSPFSPNSTGHFSTLLPSMSVTEQEEVGAPKREAKLGGAPIPVRSNSTSALEEHEPSLISSALTFSSTTVNSLTDPSFSIDAPSDASRAGFPVSFTNWNIQHDLMDAFLSNSPTSGLGGASPPMSPTSIPFHHESNGSLMATL
ncbi:hypothetical protein MVES1_002265 [Malassezia vespertilionis]|uniref:TEA domain-containing protein n=1 Tax=Malassezia vespertilionis TaxID=2020962 RepID=A0A2N1JC34_9BASI|nr:uncharacterized protein MVES1_002265 [Malassezia vespertilionis]PKI84121.1 hypothetical protein MVES_002136 [Malassezia vespertilionis]WFD06910.1 hypothetical protein MVES1_002265 [Malassezia vespertilionis]